MTDAERFLVVKLHNERRSYLARGLETRGDPGPQPAAANMMQLVRRVFVALNSAIETYIQVKTYLLSEHKKNVLKPDEARLTGKPRSERLLFAPIFLKVFCKYPFTRCTKNLGTCGNLAADTSVDHLSYPKDPPPWPMTTSRTFSTSGKWREREV